MIAKVEAATDQKKNQKKNLRFRMKKEKKKKKNCNILVDFDVKNV
jgi:hypothetical protein